MRGGWVAACVRLRLHSCVRGCACAACARAPLCKETTRSKAPDVLPAGACFTTTHSCCVVSSGQPHVSISTLLPSTERQHPPPLGLLGQQVAPACPHRIRCALTPLALLKLHLRLEASLQEAEGLASWCAAAAPLEPVAARRNRRKGSKHTPPRWERGAPGCACVLVRARASVWVWMCAWECAWACTCLGFNCVGFKHAAWPNEACCPLCS